MNAGSSAGLHHICQRLHVNPANPFIPLLLRFLPPTLSREEPCFDCRGFTRWLLAQADITLAGGGATSQYGTNSNWVIKGTIDKMPKNLICCVFKYKEGKMSHTGMSMGDGNGDIIHCSTIVKHGNVFTDTPKWTHFGIPAGLYTTEELRQAGIIVDDSKNFPSLRKGSTGSIVIQLQKFLNDNYNANLKIDGKFGSKTEEAVKKFQRKKALPYNLWVENEREALK